MKKCGFTLAELLIALGIIGVCAAFMSPALVNIMPDRNKTKVLQYYAYITNANVDLLNDDEIYYQSVLYEDVPIAEEDAYNVGATTVQVPKKNPEDGTDMMSCNGGLDCTEPSNGRFCKGKSGGGKYKECLYDRLAIKSDKFKDGSTWSIKGTSAPYTISIKVDPNGNNCTYNKTSCKHPNKFEFTVDNWGNVKPNDPLSKVYLKNPGRTNAKKDKEEAGN